MIAISKVTDLNCLKQEGHGYSAFFFCKGSLLQNDLNKRKKEKTPGPVACIINTLRLLTRPLESSVSDTPKCGVTCDHN
jgi:hypothetical protein